MISQTASFFELQHQLPSYLLPQHHLHTVSQAFHSGTGLGLRATRLFREANI